MNIESSENYESTDMAVTPIYDNFLVDDSN